MTSGHKTPLPPGERPGEGPSGGQSPLTPALSPEGRGSYSARGGTAVELTEVTVRAGERVLLENARTKLILGLNRDSDAVARAAAILGLNEQEAAYLASCRMVKGVGSTALLLADGERTPLMIPMWPDMMHQIITGRSRVDEMRR